MAFGAVTVHYGGATAGECWLRLLATESPLSLWALFRSSLIARSLRMER